MDRFPVKRRGTNTTYGRRDIGMAAFSVFFIPRPSFLVHQRPLEEGHGRSNRASPFGIANIPSDNHIRDMLDPASPALLHPVFAEAVDQPGRIDGGPDVFGRFGRHVLIALDGAESRDRASLCAPDQVRVPPSRGAAALLATAA